MGNHIRSPRRSYSLDNSIHHAKGIVRKTLLQMSFHQHYQLIDENADDLSPSQLKKWSEMRIEIPLIDFYFPKGLQDELVAYCSLIGCNMTWKYQGKQSWTAGSPRPPDYIGVFYFDAKSKYKLMEVDRYATDDWDGLAETCMSNSLTMIGIPAASARGWIKCKPLNQQHSLNQSISSYIDDEVSKNSNLQCVDVTQLDSYQQQLDELKQESKKQSTPTRTKHQIPIDEATEIPPKKRQRTAI